MKSAALTPEDDVAEHMRLWSSNHALQADKGKLSRRLQSRTARQLAFAVERGR